MKTKWQIWAHLLCTPYSISALKKITDWLRIKGIIDLNWSDVHGLEPEKEPYSMSDFIEWYNDNSDTCATYPIVSENIRIEYERELARFEHSMARKIQELYNENELYKL